MSTIDLVAGHTVPVEFTLTEQDGSTPIIMTGATNIKWRFRLLGYPSVSVQEISMTVKDGPNGVVESNLPSALASIVTSQTTAQGEVTWTDAAGNEAGSLDLFSVTLRPKVSI